MLTIRQANDRGQVNLGWLESRHSFSFGHYQDPDFMGFGALRVINEDRVQPGKGFDTHPHQDMEIISYVLDGALNHKDSTGNGGVIQRGDVQRMTAGSGIRHSEFNHSDTDEVHFLQIWIVPGERNLEPGYEQKSFADDTKRGQLRLLGSQDGREGSLTIHQDVDLYATLLDEGESVSHQVAAGRQAWLQVARGSVALGDQQLLAGDGAALVGSQLIELSAERRSEVLVFDMAAD